jgi:predicted ArsR family transcriptional regulator
MAEAVVQQLTDPRALRAIAHPTRLKLMALLRRFGPLTATQAGDRIGESPAGCSFHLRQLAKWGLVEEAGGGRGRERPWQATATGTEWPVHGPPEVEEAGELLTRLAVERWFEETMGWVARRADESREWSESASLSDHMLFLTAAELKELDRRIGELLEPYVRRAADPASRPEGTRAVTYVQLGFPLPDEAAPE